MVPGADAAEGAFAGFLAGIGALVMGSTTYEWIFEHENLAEHPQKWFSRDIVSFVVSSRSLPEVAGADIRFRSGDDSRDVDGDRRGGRNRRHLAGRGR